MLEIGRICVKTAGREAGKYCVIVKKMEENFVLITGPKSVTTVKRRRCNITHLEPTMEKVKIGSDASDSEVESALKEMGFGKIGLKVSVKSPERRERPKEHREEKKPEHREKSKEEHKEKPKEVKKEHKVRKEKPKEGKAKAKEKKPRAEKPKGKAKAKPKPKAKKKSK